MKTRIVITILAVSLISVFCMSCKKETAKKGDVIELSYSIFFPPTHVQCKAGVSWAKEIEKRTEGAVKINVFPGGTLTKANECYNGVVNGISDLGMSCFAYTRGRFPVMEAADLPLGYNNGKVATMCAWEYFKTMNPKELDDVKVLYIHAHGPGLLHSKKAVYTLDDIRGLKIRSTGLSAKVVTALGGIPVAMPQGATYESLQKGVVEGTFAPMETLKGWRQAEVIKYTTECFSIGYTTSMFVVMNRKKWDSLPENIKKVFDEVSKEWINVHAKSWDSADLEGRKYTKSLGNKIIALKNAENRKWREAVKPVINEYIAEKEKAGIPAKKGVEVLKKLVSKYSSKYAR